MIKINSPIRYYIKTVCFSQLHGNILSYYLLIDWLIINLLQFYKNLFVVFDNNDILHKEKSLLKMNLAWCDRQVTTI